MKNGMSKVVACGTSMDKGALCLLSLWFLLMETNPVKIQSNNLHVWDKTVVQIGKDATLQTLLPAVIRVLPCIWNTCIFCFFPDRPKCAPHVKHFVSKPSASTKYPLGSAKSGGIWQPPYFICFLIKWNCYFKKLHRIWFYDLRYVS